MMDCSKFV